MGLTQEAADSYKKAL